MNLRPRAGSARPVSEAESVTTPSVRTSAGRKAQSSHGRGSSTSHHRPGSWRSRHLYALSGSTWPTSRRLLQEWQIATVWPPHLSMASACWPQWPHIRRDIRRCRCNAERRRFSMRDPSLRGAGKRTVLYPCDHIPEAPGHRTPSNKDWRWESAFGHHLEHSGAAQAHEPQNLGQTDQLTIPDIHLVIPPAVVCPEPTRRQTSRRSTVGPVNTSVDGGITVRFSIWNVVSYAPRSANGVRTRPPPGRFHTGIGPKDSQVQIV